MKCEKCSESLLPEQGECSTLVGYCSPAGHNHDDNCRTKIYRCVNGHVKRLSVQNSCPACDWVGKEDCNCHDEKKFQTWPE